MLGKQCWRLLTNANSLCAKVLKGRYYPEGDFWTAKCPRSSSYTWRSIMHGKKLLQQGLLWRVGDGKQIHIYMDNWIPNVILGTLQPKSQNQLVSSLITEGGQQWNEAAIRNRFIEDMVEKILCIPLSTKGCTDFASWHHMKNGVYTVRSAYNLARTMNFWGERSVDGKGSTSE